MIQVDISNIWGALSLPDLLSIEKEVADAHAMLMDDSGAGAEYRERLNLPIRESAEELRRILDAAEKICSDSDACVVVGIGGRILGAQAAIELLQGSNRNLTKKPQIFYAGNSLSSRQWKELTELLEGRDFSVIAISRSGATLEPGIALRGLRWMLERKYGTDEASSRIYAVTDPEDGALQQMAKGEQWQSFSLPAGVREAFSVLTPAGLLPMAVAGVDILQVLQGAAGAREAYNLRSFENPLWLYAGVRNALYRQGKAIELLESTEPGFRAFGSWCQRLFAASEGKDGRGIFPAAAEAPGDMSSLGQLIQEGPRNLFETVVRFAPAGEPVPVCSDWKNLDGLGYLEGKSLADVEEAAFQAMVAAHADGGVPVITMDCDALCEKTVGELVCFMELACGISAYTMGVDPFCQFAIEAYQKKTAELLGKPGEESAQ